MKYDNYAERIVPIMIEHRLIDNDEKDEIIDFIRDNGEEYA